MVPPISMDWIKKKNKPKLKVWRMSNVILHAHVFWISCHTQNFLEWEKIPLSHPKKSMINEVDSLNFLCITFVSYEWKIIVFVMSIFKQKLFYKLCWKLWYQSIHHTNCSFFGHWNLWTQKYEIIHMREFSIFYLQYVI